MKFNIFSQYSKHHLLVLHLTPINSNSLWVKISFAIFSQNIKPHAERPEIDHHSFVDILKIDVQVDHFVTDLSRHNQNLLAINLQLNLLYILIVWINALIVCLIRVNFPQLLNCIHCHSSIHSVQSVVKMLVYCHQKQLHDQEDYLRTLISNWILSTTYWSALEIQKQVILRGNNFWLMWKLFRESCSVQAAHCLLFPGCSVRYVSLCAFMYITSKLFIPFVYFVKKVPRHFTSWNNDRIN